MAQIFGGGEYGRWYADMLTRLKFDLPMPDKPKPAEPKNQPERPAMDVHETETRADPRGSLGSDQGESN